MNFIKVLLFSKIFISSIPLTNAAESFFKLCSVVSNDCATDAKANWIDELTSRNYETRQIEKNKYDGIVLVSDSLHDNMVIFLKGYKGVGRYTIKGTVNGDYSTKTNAVYSDDVAGWAHWVSPDNRNGSYVQVTKDKGGLISGHYKVTVYYEGNSKRNKPVKFKGTFANLKKKQ